VSAAVARVATAADHDLLRGYVGHLEGLKLSDRALRDRLRAARDFLDHNRDLTAWMRLPVEDRLEDLRRTKAWPFLVHLMGSGHLRLDLDLAGAKNLTGLGAAIEARDRPGFAAARAAGTDLGWTQDWVRTVLGECLAVILAWHGGTVAEVTSVVLDEFDTALTLGATIPATTKKAYRCRLASLRQILFQTRVVNDPPRRRPWARTLAQRLDAVEMAEPIRATLLRYVQTRATVLRPKTVESLLNDLLPIPACTPSPTCAASTSKASWPGTRPAPGEASAPRPAPGARSPAPSLPRRSCPCATCWTTSPPGAGTRPRHVGSSSPPTYPSSTGPCPAPWPPTSTPHS
jgi:hypothetical protein